MQLRPFGPGRAPRSPPSPSPSPASSLHPQSTAGAMSFSLLRRRTAQAALGQQRAAAYSTPSSPTLRQGPHQTESSTAASDYKVAHPKRRPPPLPVIDPPQWSAQQAVDNILYNSESPPSSSPGRAGQQLTRDCARLHYANPQLLLLPSSPSPATPSTASCRTSPESCRACPASSPPAASTLTRSSCAPPRSRTSRACASSSADRTASSSRRGGSSRTW